MISKSTMFEKTSDVQREFQTRLSVYLENIQKLKSVIKFREDRQDIIRRLIKLSCQDESGSALAIKQGLFTSSCEKNE